MSRRNREWQACEACGELEFRRRKYGKPFWCYGCAALQSATAAREMANKSGVAWSNWLASNADGAPGAAADTKGE